MLGKGTFQVKTYPRGFLDTASGTDKLNGAQRFFVWVLGRENAADL